MQTKFKADVGKVLAAPAFEYLKDESVYTRKQKPHNMGFVQDIRCQDMRGCILG